MNVSHPSHCSHPRCSCHVSDGEQWCSDLCQRAAARHSPTCNCGHAACVSQEYSGRGDATLLSRTGAVVHAVK